MVLDNYDSFTYNLVHLLEQCIDEVEVYRNDEISLSAVDRYDKIVLSPGPSLPKDAGIMMDVIDRYHPRKDILGVCLGMQAIVQYFGGELFNLEEVRHGIVRRIQLDTSSHLFQGMDDAIEVGLYHSWATTEDRLPHPLKQVAKQASVTMGVEHKQLPVYGVQFHPESIMTPAGKQIIQNWLSPKK